MAPGMNIHSTILVMVEETEEAEASGFFIVHLLAYKGLVPHKQVKMLQSNLFKCNFCA